MIRLAEAGVQWISRVPQRSTAARLLIEEALDAPEHHWREIQEDANKLRLFIREEAPLTRVAPRHRALGGTKQRGGPKEQANKRLKRKL